DQDARACSPGPPQQRLIRHASLEGGDAFGSKPIDDAAIGLDDYELDPLVAQGTRNKTAHAAVAADYRVSTSARLVKVVPGETAGRSGHHPVESCTERACSSHRERCKHDTDGGPSEQHSEDGLGDGPD